MSTFNSLVKWILGKQLKVSTMSDLSTEAENLVRSRVPMGVDEETIQTAIRVLTRWLEEQAVEPILAEVLVPEDV